MFVELYCDEPGCDCRRVLLWFLDSASGRREAVINFGWESARFYRSWLGMDDPPMVEALRGPALHLGPVQGPHAEALLDYTEQMLRRSDDYVAGLRQHCAMFREGVERPGKGAPHARRAQI